MTDARFRAGVVWNWASLALLGASGIALNVVVSRVYDAGILGVFNQVLAAYVVASMLASGGLHYSVLRAVASDRDEERSIVAGVLPPAIALAGMAALVFFAIRGAVAGWLESPRVAEGLAVITPAVFFFALNKTLLAVVNAQERMRAYAVFQSLRYLLILIGLGAAVGFAAPGPLLPAVFTLAEGTLFLILIGYVSSQVKWWRGQNWRRWGDTHFRYGLKALPSGVLMELNSRVDVLLLGWYLSDRAVGIYSFAVLFAEGFFQLQVVLQNSFNPLLAREKPEAIETMVRRARKWIVPATVAAGCAAVLIYPHLLEVLTGDAALLESHAPFAILVSGMVLASAYLPFMGILTMANLPGWHTVFMLSMVACNAAGNILLIPRYGLEGASMATAFALVSAMFLLRGMARRLAGVRL